MKLAPGLNQAACLGVRGSRRRRLQALVDRKNNPELITRQPRSATIQAELVSVLYELSASAYERIKRENPALSHALLTYIITVMAERLSFGNRAIGVLQR